MNAVNATPHAELIAELMNPNNPKNEREYAAVREIERLRETQQAIIAGALFDFMGWLTSRKERLVLSSADEASPAVEAIAEFARMRNLSLDDAKVKDWHTHPPQRTWVGLTDEDAEEVWQSVQTRDFHDCVQPFAQAIEAKLKDKNHVAQKTNS
jgi:hypothetical protein